MASFFTSPLFSNAEEQRSALRGLALVFIPGIIFVAVLIWAIAPTRPDKSIVVGCYGRGDLPLVRISPPNLWVGSTLVSRQISVKHGNLITRFT